MATQHGHAAEKGGVGTKDAAQRVITSASGALGQLTSGLSTTVPGLFLLLWALVTAVTSLLGVGLLMVPGLVRAVHVLATAERARLLRYGMEIVPPLPPPSKLRLALVSSTVWRELRWLVLHSTLGLVLSSLGVALPVFFLRDATFPLWWRFIPDDATSTSLGLGAAHSWPQAFAVLFLALGWITMILGLAPALARLQSWSAHRFLTPGADEDLSLRVAELTATRAAALDAHAVELRRIERSLHDGAQNRFVGVTVLLGAARRMVARDPAGAEELLERAQLASEQALAELRAVARSILPPVLADRGLAGALSGLAADSPVPCRVDIDIHVSHRCAAAVEATAYFIVAEALTNIAKHSGASHTGVSVRIRGDRLIVRIEDDGQGGADQAGGSGLLGIHRRIAALDGTMSLSSPPGGPTTLEVDLPCGS
ncbi:sensor histidine kinase [Streptomyces rapamycinicus]|uniref:histidine kinase n=2 Tax=Streptomyces rapamycinicus TaxID=1226757 RepID=A0A0A0N3S8_STRRN|nr:sensor domain-containing protein [Streptomyces rapamycinicus]AGP52712.1 hypothetical protein M271_05430 [Streptomyces rapamycinicus NRRL 5491]MBB4780186.1 signal transduction histidine kinase [Streptomyces rapamycinicus]RLV75159.1 hypothetical protein D3C57_138075 [Streptomyces rapamycinicus NRRL 5491]UTO60927.1 sensor domain-containing protein [Streptomyces rapamycinicus]UTP28871.1 sensor domain-containing protein [Streptomyces rapamycinicus NRRL 5491]